MPEWVSLADWSRAGGSLESVARGLRDSGVEASCRAAAVFVPGRVELFGKHTDYAGGKSLVAATERGLTLLVAPRRDTVVHWRDLSRGVEARFDTHAVEARLGHWSNYLRIVARQVSTDFGRCETGVDVGMVSDLPAASGLSSSSALVVAAFQALDSVNELRRRLPFKEAIGSREDLAGYLGAVESGRAFKNLGAGGGVGAHGGSEDHTAILCSRAGKVRQYRYAPIELEQEFPLDPNWRLLVGASGVHAKKAGGAREFYNRLAALTARAAEAWRQTEGSADPHLGAVLAKPGAAARLEEVVTTVLTGKAREETLDRVRHFTAENEEIVPAAARAFSTGNRGELGALAARSQCLAERWLHNQVPETSSLAVLARDCGAFAASAFGAGFGGAVWAMADRDEADGVLARWREAYTAAFPQVAGASEFFATTPAAGCRWLTPDSASDSAREDK